MHHVPFIKTRSLSHLPCFCQPKKNSTSYPLESYLVPQPYIQPLRDFHPPFLLPISYFFSHCYHYCLGSYICFFFLITQHSLSPPNCCQLTFSNTTSILPSLYLQGWGCSPLFRMVFQFLHDLTSDYFSIRISHCS